MSDPYFATGYIRVLYRYAQSEGVSDRQLFANTGLSVAELMSPATDMPFASQMQFCENAIAESAPGLGLRAGSQLQLAAHGMLGTAMQTSENLGTALRTFFELMGSRASIFSTEIIATRKHTGFVIEVTELSEPLKLFFSETVLHALNHCVTFFLGNPSDSVRFTLSYQPPDYAADYGEIFGASVAFGEPATGLQLANPLLLVPSPEADPETHAEAVQRCLGQLRRQQPSSVTQTIENYLLANPGKLWSLEDLAIVLALSPRTLMRRLKLEGTTYQKMRDRVLKQQAANCLGQMSVEATALSLGFADASSFRRTYRRWHGTAPREHQPEVGA